MFVPRIYVAAPWKHKVSALGTKAWLMQQGFHVTSTWTEQPDSEEAAERARPLSSYAMSDLDELLDANVLILTHPQQCSQGKATEFGIAYARFMAGKMRPPIVVGDDGTKKGNIFYHLPHVVFVESIADAIEVLRADGAVVNRMAVQS